MVVDEDQEGVSDRTGGEYLADSISLGWLARTFEPALVDEVVDAAGAREVRQRRWPARRVVLFVLACWLFRQCGYQQVMSKLVAAQAAMGGGWGRWVMSTTGSIAKARARLGEAPLRLLFEQVRGVRGSVATPGVPVSTGSPVPASATGPAPDCRACRTRTRSSVVSGSRWCRWATTT